MKENGVDIEKEIVESNKGFKKELEDLINRHSMENGSNTPDYILAEYLVGCLEVFDKITKIRAKWWGNKDTIIRTVDK